MSARQRACQQPCPGPPGDDDFLSGNCEISTVSTTTSPGNNVVLNENNGEVLTVSSTTAPGTCKPEQQGHNVDHLINVLQLESLKVKRTMGICICATTGMTSSTVGSRLSSHRQQRRICTTCKKGHRPPGHILQLGSLYGLPNRKTMGAGLSTMTGMSTTIDERQLRHQHALSDHAPVVAQRQAHSQPNQELDLWSHHRPLNCLDQTVQYNNGHVNTFVREDIGLCELTRTCIHCRAKKALNTEINPEVVSQKKSTHELLRQTNTGQVTAKYRNNVHTEKHDA